MNNLFKYGQPPPSPSIFPSRKSSASEVLSTAVAAEDIPALVQASLDSGDVKLDNIELDQDEINASNSNFENLKTNTIGTNTSTFIRYLSNTRVESNFLFGSSSDSIDSSLKLSVKGNFKVEGTTSSIDSEQVTIKDNILGIGVNNLNIDNFMNGFYVPRNDNFTGLGISTNKVGLITLPNGSFISTSSFLVQPSTNKRFGDNKSSFRFVYISDTFDMDKSRNADNPFTVTEREFINSLNNDENRISNYYTNVEMNNITCHGGNFISGISQDFNIILTKSSNVEDIYLTCNLSNQRIDLFKDLNLNNSSHNITNNGLINFTTQASTPSTYLSLGDTKNSTFRDFYFEQNGTANSNLIFNQDNFVIYKSNTLASNAILSIDATSSTTNRFEISNRLVIGGPNTANFPNIKLKNSATGNLIGSTSPISNNYIQAKTVTNSTTTTFTFQDIMGSGYSDFIFTGFLMMTDTSNDKILALRLEGVYLGSSSPTLTMTQTILSKKNITITNAQGSSDLFVTKSFSSSNLVISVVNNLTSSLKGVLRLEIIQN